LGVRFSDARAKIEWANKHIGELEKRLSDLPNSYVSRVEIDPKFSNQTIVHDVADREKLFTTIALLIGDAVHNLKCALDYAWIKTIERAAPSALSSFAKFPVYRTPEDLEAALRGREIHVSCPRLFDLMLDKICPYSGGNFFVWAVYVLNKRDKHRLLIPLTPYGSIGGIELEDEHGVIHRGDTWGIDDSPPYYVTFTADLSVKNKGQLFFSIAIDETVLEHTPRVKDTLSVCSGYVAEVVETLEAFSETI
jgi:hypothetical protein